jgi:hypothetical protein
MECSAQKRGMKTKEGDGELCDKTTPAFMRSYLPIPLVLCHASVTIQTPLHKLPLCVAPQLGGTPRFTKVPGGY